MTGALFDLPAGAVVIADPGEKLSAGPTPPDPGPITARTLKGVAMNEWRRSDDCGDSACVEIRVGIAFVFVRSSVEPLKVLAFTAAEWASFVAAAKRGQFDVEATP